MGIFDSRKDTPPFKAMDRSGVNHAETFQEKVAKQSFPNLIGRVEGIERNLNDLINTTSLLQQQLANVSAGMQVRENSHRVYTMDTNSAPATSAQGQKLDFFTDFGGRPATSISIESVGGGSLELSTNGGEFLSRAKGDKLTNESVNELRWRVTTGAAGTAKIRVGAFIGVY